MTVAQAICIAKEAKTVAKSAEDLAHEAHTMGKVNHAKQDAHEVTCATQIDAFIKIAEKTEALIQRFQLYALTGMACIIGGLIAVIWSRIPTGLGT